MLAAGLRGLDAEFGKAVGSLAIVYIIHGQVSQEAIGAQGFVFAPGWIKIENGQRSPIEKLLAAFVGWLVQEKFLRAGHRAALIEELSALKFAGHRAPFLAKMAKEHLAALTPVAL